MKSKNTSKDKYYGTKALEGLTYLEFGGINLKNSQKEIWDFKTDQIAYDLFMLARYSREIIGYQDCKNYLIKRDYKNFLKIYSEDIHTKDFLNSIITWVALNHLKKNGFSQKFYELGFTLFGCIEAHEVCNSLLPKKNKIKNITYSGEEISYLLSEIALKLHSNYKVEYSLRHDELTNDSLFFSKGVTLLYALKSIKTFYDYISKPKISVFDYNFSLREKRTKILGTGKKINYLPLDKFKEYALHKGNALLIRKSDIQYDPRNKLLRCNCLYGNKYLLESFLKDLDDYINQLKNIHPNDFLLKIMNGYNNLFSDDYVDVSIVEKDIL